MSWDALIFNGKDVPKSLDDVEKGWQPYPIASGDEIKEILSSCLPELSWDAGGYGIIDIQALSIEFHVQDGEEVDSISVRVVGEGDPVPYLVKFCKDKGWVLFDSQEGDLIDLDNPSSSWQEFVEWRDKAIKEGS